MKALQDRLARALAPDYEVLDFLGAGGMGAVYRAHHVGLNVDRAVKVLLPETATEVAVERFMREAQSMAALRHPNIVPIHDVKENEGLYFYIMDYIEGETLASHLGRVGTLSTPDVVSIADDLLSALEAVHTAGLIHRDVKPSNIILTPNRTLLCDFGIARPAGGPSDLTGDGLGGFTPLYAAPEQWTPGRELSQKTDLYQVAAVLYEAQTGERWQPGVQPDEGNWERVPREVQQALRHALALRPAERPNDAASMRRELHETREPGGRWKVAGVVAAVVIIALAAVLLRPSSRGGPRPQIALALDTAQGGPVTHSIVDAITAVLGATWDVGLCPTDTCDAALPTNLRVRNADGELDLSITVPSSRPLIRVNERGPMADWAAMADSVAYRFMGRIWSEESPLADFVPSRAVPLTGPGFPAWILADRLSDQGQWRTAIRAYETAVDLDSTCYLCSWRITELQRWLRSPPDPEHYARVQGHIDLFSADYQALIRSRLQPLDERLATLNSTVVNNRQFYLGWFQYGSEVFHRGPINGRNRIEARGLFENVVALHSGHAPTWEFLARLWIAEGREDQARDALDSLRRLNATAGDVDPLAIGIQLLLMAANDYRFNPDAEGSLEGAIGQNPSVLQDPDLDLPAAPRIMTAFGAPLGALRLGDLLESAVHTEAVSFARDFAHFSGHTMMGELDSARIHARDIRTSYSEALYGFGEFYDKWEAALLLIDPLVAVRTAGEAAAALTQSPELDNEAGEERRGARWMARMVAGRDADPYASSLGPALDSLVEALSRAAAGQHGAALQIGEALRIHELAGPIIHTEAGYGRGAGPPDPFFRTILHVLRARWHEAREESLAAERELRWYENDDGAENPVLGPTVQEIDWMFGAFARYRRAKLLESTDQIAACRLYEDVARLWANADSVLQPRLADARERSRAAACSAGTS